MRILFISDLHNRFGAIGRLPSADLLVVGGDFTQLGTRVELLAAVKLVESSFPDFVAVGGNMDCPDADAVLAETGHCLNLSHTTVRGEARIRGCGGGNASPFHTPFEWSDEQMTPQLEAIPAGEINVLTTHAPAFESGADALPNGVGVGSHAIAEFLRRTHPALHLCGHIHEAKGTYRFAEGVTVVNPGPFGDNGAFADIDFADGKVVQAALRTVEDL